MREQPSVMQCRCACAMGAVRLGLSGFRKAARLHGSKPCHESFDGRTPESKLQLTLGVDRFRGVLEWPKTWEIMGPTRTRAHLSQSASADRLTRPRHPFGPVVAIRSG